jgi:hypothetical protein
VNSFLWRNTRTMNTESRTVKTGAVHAIYRCPDQRTRVATHVAASPSQPWGATFSLTANILFFLIAIILTHYEAGVNARRSVKMLPRRDSSLCHCKFTPVITWLQFVYLMYSNKCMQNYLQHLQYRMKASNTYTDVANSSSACTKLFMIIIMKNLNLITTLIIDFQ